MNTAVYTPRSEFLRVVSERGYFHQCTDLANLDNALCAGVVPGYIGFDCTADSLHVGSLIQIMLLRWLQKTGHKPVVLMGGGTTRIGDPSGKDEARRLLSDEQITANMAGIRKVFARYLTFGDAATDAMMVDNNDWLSGIDYITFLREYGVHFTINRMLSFDSVRLRLDREQPLTFLEFNYMILQAYDFCELARRKGVRLQMGGSDQWGNIVNGVELTRRVQGGTESYREVFGLTSPLLTTASGAKMGKSASGAVWLNEERLPAYDFWQYWRNTEDADVGRFLRLFTELPLDEIARLESLQGAEINEAKKILADAVTALARGDEAAVAARRTAEETFERGRAGDDLPSVSLDGSALEAGVSVLDVLVATGLAASKGEARRLVRGGGVRLNDTRVGDEAFCLTRTDLVDGAVRLSAGKKKHALVRLG
ncbi:tyrosine--tRNA ligase [Haematospirillum jordaniae]|uniref:Tyrosine--tRNA ligase n=1 Tax=Haematospirillum jordaniae TaxID=1549855 RepID=A0A143DFG2_9PROT|nr:tyrosine--tRNA ligase [Haematospirillum jordaniae]AMW34838.1 tyrosine--tRNA ligase [Haematospirillum jordaniae]NKD45409.1 tyrosine--tRNA ligase [Haematospirillum jordaniae]NKD56793.1 tyrosine--tRNA ligase [Haematospirillum jordaniae]NKD59051.1 tyrosine--tRNA ligase [Haematospirillum jordaniae]NKD66717.1 tyrosine--tRNA ligase [Haematospirillum jordaniae]